ncbi:MAG: hypothetical protein WC728_18960 [Elusimicrobiota bacterium]
MKNERKPLMRNLLQVLAGLVLLSAPSFAGAGEGKGTDAAAVPEIGAASQVMRNIDWDLYRCVNYSTCAKKPPIHIMSGGILATEAASTANAMACRPAPAKNRDARALQCLRQFGYLKKPQSICQQQQPACRGGKAVCSGGRWTCEKTPVVPCSKGYRDGPVGCVRPVLQRKAFVEPMGASTPSDDKTVDGPGKAPFQPSEEQCLSRKPVCSTNPYKKGNRPSAACIRGNWTCPVY